MVRNKNLVGNLSCQPNISLSQANNGFFSPLFSGVCPNHSGPVEMDESMTGSTLDLAWPPSCNHFSGNAETSNRPRSESGYMQPVKPALQVNQQSVLQSSYHHEPRSAVYAPPTHSGRPRPHPTGVWSHGLREQVPYEQDFMISHRGPSPYQDHPVEDAESLEPPLPLMSHPNCTFWVPPQCSAAKVLGQCLHYIIITNTKSCSLEILH